MLCTFCGTENRPENKFCGMCGVRMDRRQTERRGLQNSAALRCPSCGHINEAGHKFCGMCGARTDRRTLTDRRPMPPDASRATAIANAQLPTPETAGGRVAAPPPRVEPAAVTAVAPAAEAERPSDAKTDATIFRDESPLPVRAPRVSGPSFLGLGDEPTNDARYLLEDEGSSGGVLKKLVLIAILAAIAGLVFVGWRSGTFRANPTPSKSPATEPASLPSPRSNNQNAVPDGAPSATSTSAPAEPVSSDSVPSSAQIERSDAKDPQPVAAKSPSPEPEERSLNAAESKSPAVKTRAADPPVAAKKPSAALLRAQQYLQGRGGVRQNCEQGLVYLRAATEQNDPAAAVQMGALYASGHCVAQDRVMAYRWFNSAHELDPGNQWIQTDLQQLWARMTPQERQKAGP
jgi:Double zinc ribbon